MIVVDRRSKRRSLRRRRSAGLDTATNNGSPSGSHPKRYRPLGDGRLDVVSAAGLGSFPVHTARIPHPETLSDVVAFLVEAGSPAYELLVRADDVEVSFGGTSPAVLVGPVELVRMDRVDAAWFRSLVAVVYTAAGGTSQGLAMHEKTIGIPSTVVAFLRPERMSLKRSRKGATSAESSSPRVQRRKRRDLRPVTVQDEDAA